MAKVIKLTDNNGVTMLPVTEASYVQISYMGVTKSVTEAIIENEEVTAAALNDLNTRLNNLSFDASYTSGLGILSSKTQDGSTKYAYVPIAGAGQFGVIRSNSATEVDSNMDMTRFLKIDSSGLAWWEHPTASNVRPSTSYGPLGTKNLSSSNSFAVPFFAVDAWGHIVAQATYTYTLPNVNNVTHTSTSTNANYPILFKNTNTNTTTTSSVRYDSDGLTNSYYNPATNTMYIKYSYTTEFKQSGMSVPNYEVVQSNMTDLTLL